MFLNGILLDTTTKAATTGGKLAGLMPILSLVLVFALMYFLMIRPQKKKQKEEAAMRDGVRVGDEVTTIGGITGRVVAVKEDTLTIESGANRNKLTFKKWALQSVDTIHEKSEFDDDDDDDDDI